MNEAKANTDRELWRDGGDYYAASIHVTQAGGIGINIAGTVFVKTADEWHRLAREAERPTALSAVVASVTDHEKVAKELDSIEGVGYGLTHSQLTAVRCARDILRATRSASERITGMPFIKMLKDQRDGAADVLRRLMHKLREESGSEDPMEPFAYDHSWELLAIEADAILAKCPSWTQQLRNIAEGIGMTYEELCAAADKLPKENATDATTDRNIDK